MIALAEPANTRFNPSSALRLAQHDVRRPAREAASNLPLVNLLELLRFWTTSVSISVRTLVPAEVIAKQVEGAVRPHIVASVKLAAKSTRDLVGDLRTMGMPISGIAEVVGVQRKTVYSWLNQDAIAEPRNHDRLQAVYDLLRQEPPGSLQFLTRHWERQMIEGGTLKEVLAAESLDLERAHKALEWLRPAILRSVKQTSNHSGFRKTTSPGSSLTEYLEAVTK
jgi:hypothetical protein